MKKNHKNKEIKYEKQDVPKAMNFNKKWLELGTTNNKKELIKGKTIKKLKHYLFIKNLP